MGSIRRRKYQLSEPGRLVGQAILRTIMQHPCVTGAARKTQAYQYAIDPSGEEVVLPDRIELSANKGH